MQFSISQPSIKQAIAAVAPAAGKSEIFSMIALEAVREAGPRKEMGLRVAARDGDGGISCFLSPSVEDPGGVLLPARLLKELIDSFPPERVYFRLNASAQRVEIKCAHNVANIPGRELAEMHPLRSHHADALPFTTRTMDPNAHYAKFSADALRQVIERTTFAASGDVSRPTLTGADLHLSGIAARFATTDGFRLAIAEAALEEEFGEGVNTIIPANRLESLAKLLAFSSEGSPIHMYFASGWALFSLAGDGKHPFAAIEMETSLIDSKFPDYRAIIPKSHAIGARVARNELEKAINVAGLYARDNANIVKFRLSRVNGDTSLKISAASAEMGDCAIDVDVRESDGDFDTFEIAFNYRFALDYLRRADAEVWMEFTQPTRPAKIQSAYDRDGKDFYVLMPMQPK